MPLGTKNDLKLGLGREIKFHNTENNLHANVGGKEFIAKERDDKKSWFLIGKEGVSGMLLRRSDKQGYHIVVFDKQKLKM